MKTIKQLIFYLECQIESAERMKTSLPAQSHGFEIQKRCFEDVLNFIKEDKP